MSPPIEQLRPLFVRAVLIGAMVFCGLLTGCTRSPSRSEIPGVYRATYPFGSETLVLRQDGSYSQEVRINRNGNTNAEYRSTGVWRYGAPDGWPREAFVYFDSSFIIVFDEWGEQARVPRALPPGGISAHLVEKRGRALRILGASEKSFAVYRKKGAVETNSVTPAP